MIEKINEILSEWDPIGLGYPLSIDEYRQYAPKIYSLINNEKKLKNYIVKLLYELGLDYDTNNILQKEDINNVLQSILMLKKLDKKP